MLPHPNRQRARDRRHRDIIQLVRSGITRVDDLAARVEVSEATLRRDLAFLEASGELARNYGGARPHSPFRETQFSKRMTHEVAAKAGIGATAAQWVEDDTTVFVDAGSTCAQLVENTRDRKGLTVVTRGLEIALLLADSQVEVIVVGGRVCRKSHGLAGAITLFVMERLSVDIAFLGCDAVHPEYGVGEPTLEEAATKEMIAHHARRTVVLAHAAKLAEATVPAWARLPPGWTLVTDEPREDHLGAFRRRGIDVVSVGS
ncbi:MAG: DeoR/GlpR family DNA-binding transcription regulator [Actinomycetota bacterium]